MSRLDSIVAAFDPDRLRIARQLAKKTKAQLVADHGFNSSLLTQYERGRTRPSAANLAKLALALGVEPAFFMKERPLPIEGPAHFRSLRSSTKAERDQAVAEAIVLWDIVQIVERHLRLPLVDVPSIPLAESATKEEIEAAALAVRDEWALPDGPVGDVVRLLESHGVVVARLRFETRRLDAFSIELGTRPFVLLGDDKGDAARSRLDASHELGHLVVHDDPEPGDGVIERQAHRFGAAFLLPARQIGPLLPSRFDMRRLIELKHQWGVSIAALLYRSRELGVMTEATYRRAVTFMSSSGYRAAEPAPLLERELPILMQRSVEALTTLGFTLDDLAREVRLPVDRIERLLAASDERPSVHLDPATQSR